MPINLLPWREELRGERTRQFFFVLGGAAIISVALLLGVHLYFATKIRQQRGVNEYLQQHITLLDAQINEIKTIQAEKKALIERMDLIQQLQMNRPLVVHLFDEMVRILPNGVYVTSIKREGDTITITGKAESNTRVSELMRNIEKSEWLRNPVLTEIKSTDEENERVRDFQLILQQRIPRFGATNTDMEAKQNGNQSQ